MCYTNPHFTLLYFTKSKDSVNTFLACQPLHVVAGYAVNPSQSLGGGQVWEDDSGPVGSAAVELHAGSSKRNPGRPIL